jgi:hypothetical protein
MPVSVTCPFCRSAFTLGEVPPARRSPCPNCGESVPVSADSPAIASAVAPPPPVVKSSNLVFLSLGLTALIVAGFVTWFYLGPKPPPAPPTVPASPPPTLTPRSLGGLKYIPKDAQVVAALQPAALWQYADRTGQNADALLAEIGVPKELLAQLRDAGAPPEAIQSLVLAANADNLWAVVVLTLREPVRNEAKFREVLKVKGQPPQAELAGVPVSLYTAEADEKTYLFALNEKELAGAKSPTAGYEALRPGLRESIDKVSPAAFAWAATDAKDWAKLPILKFPLVAQRVPAELLTRLDGVRAAAVGVSLEPDLVLGVGVQMNDSTVARDQAEAMKAKLADLKGATTTASGEWAEATVPLDPPAEALPKVKAALRK